MTHAERMAEVARESARPTVIPLGTVAHSIAHAPESDAPSVLSAITRARKLDAQLRRELGRALERGH